MSARDLAAELEADRDTRELEALRALRDAVLAAYDTNGEMLCRASMSVSGGRRTFRPDFVCGLTEMAYRAVRR